MIYESTLFERKRRRLLIGNLVGFTVFYLSFLVNILYDWNSSQLTGWSSTISALGFLVWTVYLIQLLQLTRTIRSKRKLANVLNDEFVQLIRLKSFMAGFWVLLGVCVIFLVLSPWFQFNLQFALLSIIFIGVVAYITAYLIYEKE